MSLQAHIIRNENSKMHSNISSLRICHKLFLTGTPIQNSLNELFTLLQLLDPEQFPSRAEFNEKYQQSVNGGCFASVIIEVLPFGRSSSHHWLSLPVCAALFVAPPCAVCRTVALPPT